MRTAPIKELRSALTSLDENELRGIVYRMAKFKTENKELLSYLLFDARDDAQYIADIKAFIDDEFLKIHATNIYFIKKNLRRILRQINKYIRFTCSDQIAVEILIYYLKKINLLYIDIHKSIALQKLYNGQLKKINTLISKMHEDLQYDYKLMLKDI